MIDMDDYANNLARDESTVVYDASDRFSEWRRALILNEDKKPRALLANALTALRQAPEWKGVIRYDEFSHTPVVTRRPPYEEAGDFVTRAWTDYDDARTTEWLQREGILVKTVEAAVAAMTVAKENKFHPVREYLEGLTWDNTPRIENTLVEVFGCTDTRANREMLRCFMIAAVARIYQPGCKMDNVLILEGQQGVRKSTACAALFANFFTDDIADLGSKDAAMQARGVWCIELAELSSMGRAQTEQVKAFITRRVDRFRPSYGRHVIEAPRECVFIGTTNSDSYLKDETGGRRFWPLKCGKVNIELLSSLRNALWAEARCLYELGEPWWVTDTDILTDLRDLQEQRYEGDPWIAEIAEFVKGKTEVTVREILGSGCLGIEKGKQVKGNETRVGGILTKMGWGKYRGSRDGHRPWIYTRPELPEDTTVKL